MYKLDLMLLFDGQLTKFSRELFIQLIISQQSAKLKLNFECILN